MPAVELGPAEHVVQQQPPVRLRVQRRAAAPVRRSPGPGEPDPDAGFRGQHRARPGRVRASSPPRWSAAGRVSSDRITTCTRSVAGPMRSPGDRALAASPALASPLERSRVSPTAGHRPGRAPVTGQPVRASTLHSGGHGIGVRWVGACGNFLPAASRSSRCRSAAISVIVSRESSRSRQFSVQRAGQAADPVDHVLRQRPARPTPEDGAELVVGVEAADRGRRRESARRVSAARASPCGRRC